MEKSIFKRYLGMTMAIVILSFIMLGSVMMAFFSHYWRQEKKEVLTQNASSIAKTATRFLTERSGGGYQLQTDVLNGFLSSFSTSIDADIFITDLEGGILLGNYASSKLQDPGKVPVQAAASAAEGLYEGRSDFGGLYKSRYYIVGVPMKAQEDGPSVGAVFAATSAASINVFQSEVFKIFLVAAAAALAVTFCLVGAFAYRMVKPLRQQPPGRS